MTPADLRRVPREPKSHFRLLARGWAFLGTVLLIFDLAFAIAHYGFGVPMSDKGSGHLADPNETALTIFMIGLVGSVFAGMGFAILRLQRSNVI